MEEKQIYGVQTVYRERGAHLRRLEQFDKSKAAYDEAFKFHPEDVRLLVGRSRVCADIVQAIQANEDAELALKQQPQNIIAKDMQALAMYSMTEFEKSLLLNYRGRRLRQYPPCFSTGISKGTETIEDCIGKNAGKVMLDFLPLIKKTEFTENLDTISLHQCRIPHQVEKYKKTQMEAHNDKLLARVLAMKYLGNMAYDKFFIQKLKEDHRLNSANSEGTEKLKELISEGLRKLTKRQDMLRAQRPYYSIKLAEKSNSSHHNKFKQNMLIREREAGARTADKLLMQLERCLTEQRINDLMKQSERMQTFLDKKTHRTLPAKDKYIDRLYQVVGRGYLNLHRLSYTIGESGNRRRIAFLTGMPIGRAKLYDSVINLYPYKFLDIKRATEKTKELLDMCENATQRCWLYYEMANLQSTQKNFTLCKFYSKRCQREAQDVPSVTWWLNGCFSMLRGDMQQGNANEFYNAIDEALEYAKRHANAERMVAFLTKCAEVAADLMSTDDHKAVAQREQQILSVMDEPQRVETQVLFRNLSTIPVGRRFKVLPQKTGLPADHTERHRYKQPGLTVVMGQPVPLRRPPRTTVPGRLVLEDF